MKNPNPSNTNNSVSKSGLILVSKSFQATTDMLVARIIITLIVVKKEISDYVGSKNPSNAKTGLLARYIQEAQKKQSLQVSDYSLESANTLDINLILGNHPGKLILDLDITGRNMSLSKDKIFAEPKGSTKESNGLIVTQFSPNNFYVPLSTLNAFPFTFMSAFSFYRDGIHCLPVNDQKIINFVSSTNAQLKKFNDNATDLNNNVKFKNKVQRTAYLYNLSNSSVNEFLDSDLLSVHTVVGDEFSNLFKMSGSEDKDSLALSSDIINSLKRARNKFDKTFNKWSNNILA